MPYNKYADPYFDANDPTLTVECLAPDVCTLKISEVTFYIEEQPHERT